MGPRYSSNPFDRHDIDPLARVDEITARFRDLAEDATDEGERQRIRKAWEALTLHPKDRLAWALDTFLDSRGDPPSAPPMRGARTSTSDDDAFGLTAIVPLPTLGALLTSETNPTPAPVGPTATALSNDPLLKDEAT
jgi:hypothetical protein